MNKLINILKKEKLIPLDKFININLYNKKFGYYMKKNPFGSKGDFTTAPLISHLFSEMLAVWCVAYWEYLNKPKKIIIIELGPGDGSLCKDLLQSFKRFKNFYRCLEIKLLEVSSKLKRVQKLKIKNDKVKWLNSLEKINQGPVIFIGNEFFDALPIKQVLKKNNIFYEKYVKWSKNQKVITPVFKKAKNNLTNEIKKLKLNHYGNLIEYPIKSLDYLKIISKKINKLNGGLLIFDYGHDEFKSIDTLQAIKKHQYSNIFKNPGEIDLTSHINFKIFRNILEKNKLEVKKISSQSEFLQKMGILQRAEILSKKKNFKDKINIFYRIRRLLHNEEMGSIFKVMFAQKKNGKFSLGF
jgi:NADH dehydrogenase [ubiquinone] 1 alpha subcomplex assembly factor 7